MEDHPVYKMMKDDAKVKELDELVDKVNDIRDLLKEAMGVECDVVVCVHPSHEAKKCTGVFLMTSKEMPAVKVASILGQGFETAAMIAEETPPEGTTLN